MKIYFRTPVEQSLEKVKEGFNRDLFMSLAPFWARMELLRFDGCKTGDEVHILLKTGRKQKWVSHITHDAQDTLFWEFVDEGKVLPWPFKSWKHTHRVNRIHGNKSEIIDDIDFDAGLWGVALYPILWLTFGVRPQVYRTRFKG